MSIQTIISIASGIIAIIVSLGSFFTYRGKSEQQIKSLEARLKKIDEEIKDLYDSRYINVQRLTRIEEKTK